MAMLAFILCSFALVSMQTTSADLDLARVSQSFTKILYRETVKNKPDQNLVISPLSIHAALGLLSMGATAETAAQLQAYLGSNSRFQIAQSFYGLLTRHQNSSILQLANKVYTMQGSTVNPNFIEIITKLFFSEAEIVNFADSENAARSINTWVESKTNNKIKDLISAGSLNLLTSLVLVNAIYFNGKWVHAFPVYSTRDRAFFHSETEFEMVPMMTQKTQFLHGEFESLDAAAIELPYKDSDLSMVIVLPNQRSGIYDLEAKIQNVNFFELYTGMISDRFYGPLNRMSPKEVRFLMPKFKTEFSIVLNDVLKAMGITRIFENAELGDLLVSYSPVCVSGAVHKAFINVSEEGTEAAAATGISSSLHSGGGMETAFIVDHPFLYFIKDSQGVVYFAGKYLRNSE